jgi:hypothetical protein
MRVVIAGATGVTGQPARNNLIRLLNLDLPLA